MVSLEALQAVAATAEPVISGPRISFSSEFLDENNFISICPQTRADKDQQQQQQQQKRETDRASSRNTDHFEFLSGNLTTKMITADELISEGKLLPFWQMHHAEKLNKLSLKQDNHNNNSNNSVANEAGPGKEAEQSNDQDRRISWFLDDDPSPRPPKCTVLWKELLRLRKQRPSTLSPSSSSSSSSSSGRSVATEIPSTDERKKGIGNREKVGNNNRVMKKGLERTRSASIRIRPMINVPICTQTKSSSLPPLFPIRRSARLD